MRIGFVSEREEWFRFQAGDPDDLNWGLLSEEIGKIIAGLQVHSSFKCGAEPLDLCCSDMLDCLIQTGARWLNASINHSRVASVVTDAHR